MPAPDTFEVSSRHRPPSRLLRRVRRALCEGERDEGTLGVSAMKRMPRVLGYALWGVVSVLAALALSVVALQRDEPVNSLWIVTADVCVYAIGYRFYAKFIAASVMALDDRRATPAERLRNSHDFEPTNKWIVFGHHFAAIAGPGPLVGPTLAAIRISAGHDMADFRRGPRWMRAGLHRAVCLDASRRQVAGSNGARRDRSDRRVHRAPYRAPHHDHSPCRHRIGRRQRAARQPLG